MASKRPGKTSPKKSSSIVVVSMPVEMKSRLQSAAAANYTSVSQYVRSLLLEDLRNAG